MPRIRFKWDSRSGPLLIVAIWNTKISFALICHRKKDHCIRIFGHTSPLCARCMGICLGTVTVLLLNLVGLTITPAISMPISIILVSPLLLDGFTQLLGLRKSNNILRLVTGFSFSIGVMQFML